MHHVRSFAQWFSSLPYKHKIVIAGNHDLPFDEENYAQIGRKHGHGRGSQLLDTKEVRSALIDTKGIIYLQDSGCEIEGIRFWGR